MCDRYVIIPSRAHPKVYTGAGGLILPALVGLGVRSEMSKFAHQSKFASVNRRDQSVFLYIMSSHTST